MSELKTNLQSILQEKTAKIIPQNIKKDIEVLGVTGSYDKEDIKELQDELANAEQELADVRRDLDNSTATVSGSGENITLSGTAEARFKKAPLPLGNTEQEVIEAQAGTTVEGESILASGIDLSKVEILNINGNTKQETTTGKNKIISFKTRNSDFVEYFFDKSINNSFIMSGLSNLTVSGFKVTIKTSNGDINLGYKNIETNKNFSFTFSITTEDLSKIQNSTYTPFIQFWSSNGFAEADFKNVMIRDSSIADDTYEPYTGGKAAPNPDYPYEAYSAGANMNLFDKDDSNFNASWDGGDANKLTLLANGNIQTTADYSFWRAKAIDIKSLKPNTQYTLSIELISATSTQTSKAVIRIPYNNGTSGGHVDFNGNESLYQFNSLGKQTFTFTTPSDMVHIGLSLNSDGTSTTAVFGNIKIEEGSKATAYSAYNQGNMNVEISNKNLFNLTSQNFKDGTMLGAAKKVELALKPNTNYTLSSNEPNGTSTETNIWFNGPSSSENGVGINRPKTVITDANGKLYVSIRTTEIDTVFENCWIQLEEGSTATDHVAHEGQNFTIPTQSPFRKISDYKDTFVKKVDGKWYEKHVIGQVTFDGSEDENWLQDNNDTYITVNDAKGTGAIPVISNYFTYTGNASGNSWGQLRFGMSNNNLIFFGNLILSDFKAWLSTHNTIVNYVLAVPTYIECTQEQSAILDQINTFYETTNIFSTDEVFPNFDFTYNKVYASPSPDDESPIQTVSGDVEVLVQNKNLLSDNITDFTRYGVVITKNQDKSITLNGTASSAFNIILKENFKIPANQYTLSLEGRKAGIGIYTYVNNDLQVDKFISASSNDSIKSVSFTADSELTFSQIRLYIISGTSFNNLTIYPQLEVGTIQTLYTPHQEQVLPLALKSKNLFDGLFEIGTIDNSGVKQNSTTAIRTVNFISINPNTQYILSSEAIQIRSVFYDENYQFVGTHEASFTSRENEYYMKFVLSSTDLQTKAQLEEGSTATSYEPCYNYELCKIGTAQDYFYKENNKWYLYKAIGKAILDGTEFYLTWGLKDTDYFSSYVNKLISNPGIPNGNIISTHFPFSNYSVVANATGIGCFTGGAYIGISVPKSILSDVSTQKNAISSLKDWLTNNNATFYYVLKTQTDTEITGATLISQLEAIRKAISYDEQTNVSSNTIALFDIIALRNMNDTLSTLENEIELLP